MIIANQQTATLETEKAGGNVSLAGSALRQVAGFVAGVVMGGVRHVEANIVPVCICGAIMFPAYWIVWKYLFPQPYENIWLRLVGSALCLFVAAKNWWPRGLRAYLPVIWLGNVLYSGPFFFTFMLLQNNTSDVWLMSTLAALFLVVLLVDWISLISLFVVGSFIAWRIHLLVSPGLAAVNLYAEFVPIFLFALIAGTVFNYKAAGLRQAGERARREIGALMAQEVQSPLFSVRTHAASLSKFLPTLIRAYVEPGQDNRQPRTVPESQLRALERLPTRIEEAIEQINSMIETLLAQDGRQMAGGSGSPTVSIAQCIDEAVARLPLRAELDRARIIFHRGNDFRFGGSRALMTQVLTRVLEASFDAIYSETGAELVIDLVEAGEWNGLRLRDSSAELRPAAAKGLLRFGFAREDKDFTNRSDLALAHLVLERMGGSVSRTVALGGADEVLLWFPQAGAR